MKFTSSVFRLRLARALSAATLLAGALQMRGQAHLVKAASFSGAGVSSSAAVADAPAGLDTPSAAEARGTSAAILRVTPNRPSLWHSLGLESHFGINGVGGSVALPVARHFNVRLAGDYFSYKTSFVEQGANVTAALKLGHGRALVDWYPFSNGFRVSPQLVFAVQTHVDATVLVPSGSSISLDGSDYVSSNTDPLHGSATVKTRSVAPGLTVGWGNIAPRDRRHLTFPVEVGFYYIGQPDLAVSFTGSACDPRYPQPVGCQSVNSDAGFQRDLSAFIRRNQNNLSYASFFPEATFGVGYRF